MLGFRVQGLGIILDLCEALYKWVEPTVPEERGGGGQEYGFAGLRA